MVLYRTGWSTEESSRIRPVGGVEPKAVHEIQLISWTEFWVVFADRIEVYRCGVKFDFNAVKDQLSFTSFFNDVRFPQPGPIYWTQPVGIGLRCWSGSAWPRFLDLDVWLPETAPCLRLILHPSTGRDGIWTKLKHYTSSTVRDGPQRRFTVPNDILWANDNK